MSQSPTSESTKKKERLSRQNSSGPQKFGTADQVIRQPSDHKTNNSDRNRIRLGVCAMEKKTSCKPMQEILERLNATGDIVTIIFPEPIILYAPIQEWPIVDCLITFHSTGFPLSKVEAYIELRKPYMVNELKFQESLLWRHKMYEILVQHGIPVPKHYIVIDEKLVKKTKKSHPASCPPDNSDGNQIQQIQTLEEKISVKDFEGSKDKDERGSQSSSQRSSFVDKDGRPTLIVSQCMMEESALIDKEEEKSDSNKEKLLDVLPQTMSRQHSQSSLVKPIINESKIEGFTHRRQLSEKLGASKSNKADSVYGDESPHPETSTKTLLHNYHKKFHTKVDEHDDYVMIGEHKLQKPFVEKPLDAEDHQINIYYSKSDGGGCKSLFRKTNNISSSFDANSNQIRRGNYLYEVFLPTEGFDIKVYTVGPNYAHAEARKSPVLDGIVQRTKEGKEVRYPVNLTYEEKIIAKKIVFAFDQQICGFDLLRSKGKSYVCDVNGWSFVKGNAKYYTDCAMLLRAMMLARFAPERLTPLHPMLSQLNNNKRVLEVESVFRPTHDDNKPHLKEELRSVVTIFRHGDRTPKQKMKMITRDHRYLALFDDQEDKKKEIKLKTIKQMQKVLDITQEIIEDFYTANFTRNTQYTAEVVSKHLQLFSVLKKGGHFEGINRKVQLKPLEWSKKVDPVTKETIDVVTEGLFILKWGGELTHSGIKQAEELGAIFRNQVYPQENEGILRLHSTYRHDLKIYASQEGRCQNTAAAFCKGLLELEGDLTPILVSLVRKDDTTQELLEFNKSQESALMAEMNRTLMKIMNSDEDLYEVVRKVVSEEDLDSNMINIIKDVGRPLTLLKKTYDLLKKLQWNIKKSIATNEDTYYLSLNDMGLNQKSKESKPEKKSDFKDEPVCEEIPMLIFKRWKKLESDFYKPKEGVFDISKIPDIYYSIRYDLLHSKKMVEANKEICEELFDCSQRLAAFVIPAEYGLTDQERANSSLTIIANLVKKVTHDLIWWNSPFINQAEQIVKDEQSFLEHKGLDPSKIGEDVKSIWRHVRTRLYFTSASHLYSLFNLIALGLKLFSPKSENFRILQRFTSLDFLSHIMIRLYENLNAKQEDPNRFRLEIMFSQGCKMEKASKFSESDNHRVPVTPSVVLNSQLTLNEIEQFLNGLLKLGTYEDPNSESDSDPKKDEEQKTEN